MGFPAFDFLLAVTRWCESRCFDDLRFGKQLRRGDLSGFGLAGGGEGKTSGD